MIFFLAKSAVVGLKRKQSEKAKCELKTWREIIEMLKKRRKEWNVNFKRKNYKM